MPAQSSANPSLRVNHAAAPSSLLAPQHLHGVFALHAAHPPPISRRQWLAAGTWLCAAGAAALSGCTASAPHPAAGHPAPTDTPMPIRLHQLGPADVLLLGEQHDAPEHQRLHLAAVLALVEFNELAAVVLEMADAGHATTRLAATASAQAVQQALDWRDTVWPWADYGPAVMAAVTAGIPVLGGNLPRQRNAAVMKEPEWDLRVPPDVLQRHRNDVRDGHCNLLPSGQIGPMTRIQLARDEALAITAATAVQRGKTVLVLCGSQHAHRQLGAPLYLPARLRTQAVRLAADGPRADDAVAFNAIWYTAPVPPVDHCARLREQLGR